MNWREGRRKALAASLATSIVCALMATIAPAAPAAEFAAESYPAGISGGQIEGIQFGLEGGAVECGADTLAGTMSAASSELELGESPTECSAFGFLSAGIAWNGCKSKYRLGEKQSSNSWSVVVDFVCPEGKVIVITAATCEVQIPGQTGMATGTARLPISIPPAIEFELSLEKLHYTVTKDGFLCPFNGTGTRTSGVRSLTLTISGTGPSITIR